jgi:hypothetical protein
MAGVALPVSPLRRHIFIAAPPPAAVWPASRIMVIDFATAEVGGERDADPVGSAS